MKTSKLHSNVSGYLVIALEMSKLTSRFLLRLVEMFTAFLFRFISCRCVGETQRCLRRFKGAWVRFAESEHRITFYCYIKSFPSLPRLRCQILLSNYFLTLKPLFCCPSIHFWLPSNTLLGLQFDLTSWYHFQSLQRYYILDQKMEFIRKFSQYHHNNDTSVLTRQAVWAIVIRRYCPPITLTEIKQVCVVNISITI